MIRHCVCELPSYYEVSSRLWSRQEQKWIEIGRECKNCHGFENPPLPYQEEFADQSRSER